MLVYKLCKECCPEKIPVTITNKLGDGADGEVFEYAEDSNKVIKFCVLFETLGIIDLEKDYYNINKTLSYLMKEPSRTYARVYSQEYMAEWQRQVYGTCLPQKYYLYYYIMEKLYPLSEDEKKIFHSILSHEDRGIKKDFPPAQIKEMLSGMARGLDFDEEKVIFFVNNFKKTPIIHNDIHVRNIMKDIDGNFKMIDFDRCEIKTEITNVEST